MTATVVLHDVHDFPFPGKVLEHLQYNLQSKAKVYEDHALGAIFLLNNYNYILKSMKK